MKNYFFEKGRDFFDVFLSRALGSFIPHDRVLNTPVAYDLYFNHKQLLKIQKLIQKLIYHLFCKLTDYPKNCGFLKNILPIFV